MITRPLVHASYVFVSFLLLVLRVLSSILNLSLANGSPFLAQHSLGKY